MTTAHDFVELQRRVHALERRVRASRLGALLALAALATLACQAAPPQAPETLRLRRLEYAGSGWAVRWLRSSSKRRSLVVTTIDEPPSANGRMRWTA